MLEYNDNKQIINLNLSDLYVIEKWIKKYVYEIKSIESVRKEGSLDTIGLHVEKIEK